MVELKYLVPNGITLSAVAVGLTAIPLGLRGQFEMAVICIYLSGILDAMDGVAARALGACTDFGKELDSLCDFINFGVAPGVLLYVWKLSYLGWTGWVFSLVYVFAMGCRLARFNSGVDFNAKAGYAHNFFMGVPAPAGAALVVLPMKLTFKGIGTDYITPYTVVAFTVFCTYMLVSTVPTFSSKMFNKGNLLPSNKLLLLLNICILIGCVGFIFYDFW
eukprot:CAMPEP_0174262158 /NCGR_PEP_ID=MMETSP0439-20130205/12807_1 /TAXON_ID=0 /ORGANISM="Stereomyxa ramosa, Strain Chinc5" /LENGTH=218 /DNA_ID=CAMNT_0015346811 /DNA_START=15 /DNA_END=668 /DNA_ORIENTATION=+